MVILLIKDLSDKVVWIYQTNPYCPVCSMAQTWLDPIAMSGIAAGYTAFPGISAAQGRLLLCGADRTFTSRL